MFDMLRPVKSTIAWFLKVSWFNLLSESGTGVQGCSTAPSHTCALQFRLFFGELAHVSLRCIVQAAELRRMKTTKRGILSVPLRVLCPDSSLTPAHDCGHTPRARVWWLTLQPPSRHGSKYHEAGKARVSTKYGSHWASHDVCSHEGGSPSGKTMAPRPRRPAVPLLWHTAHCCFVWFCMRFAQGRSTPHQVLAPRLVLWSHDKHDTHSFVYLSPWSSAWQL